MDYRQSDERSEKISEILKSIDDWLERSDKSLNYKSSELEKLDEQELRVYAKGMEDILNQIYKRIEKTNNLLKIKESTTLIELNCEKLGNEVMCVERHIKAYLYNKDEKISCLLDTQNSPDKIECTYHSDKIRIYSHQITSFLQDIEKQTLSIYYTSNIYYVFNQAVPKDNINIIAVFYTNSDKMRKKNSYISQHSNVLVYADERSRIIMTWY